MPLGIERRASTYQSQLEPRQVLRLPFFSRYKNILVLLFLTQFLISCTPKQEKPAMEPPVVKVTEVVRRDVPIYQEWVAQLNGPTNAQISPRVQGYLLKQDYRDGFFVKKGQLLYEIDSLPYQAALAQVKAQVAVAVANLSNANTNVARDKPLAAQNAIPQKQLDTDIATQAANQAQLDAAKAELTQAELNLSWTKVYSPIDGIAGISSSQVGNLVGTTTNMTMISQVNPIWAYFNISESDYLSRANTFYQVISGRQVSSPVLDFIQANGATYPLKGRIILVNREVASQTGTIQLVAEFPNANATLRPGGFGRVRFQTGLNKGALLVPQAAVIEVQSIYQVAVVTPDNKANFRVVKVGNQIGTDWIITDGLNPNEKVIVQGFMKIREGTPVDAKPFVAAPAEAN
jgi:membrane fusion protein (multidrug efflux system)